MKISDKDRSQILRMAGNIACGFVGNKRPEMITPGEMIVIGTVSAQIAIETMLAADQLIKDFNEGKE